MTEFSSPSFHIGIIGCGPAGLTLAIALIRRVLSGENRLHITIFERASDHRSAATYNPNRSYTIDITGHGLKAARYIQSTTRFDISLINFYGIRAPFAGVEEKCFEQGWTGSRGDICRALLAELLEISKPVSSHLHIRFETSATIFCISKGIIDVEVTGQPVIQERFDLIVGCDGAGSSARKILQTQQSGFLVQNTELSNHSTMLALDLVKGNLDPNFLYVLAPPPSMMVAGAICGPKGKNDPLWFCQVGRSGSHTYNTFQEAYQFLSNAYPDISKLASNEAIETFSKREAMPTGRAKQCSSLHGGKVALLGDSGAPFPPFGQGVNAAMESATILDTCIGKMLTRVNGKTSFSTMDIETILQEYTSIWLPEAKAAREIALSLDLEQSLFVTIKARLYMWLGVSALSNSKDARLTYLQALQIEKRADKRIISLGIASLFAVVAVAVSAAAVIIIRKQ
jgi:kynurenine 3-monooxygenase